MAFDALQLQLENLLSSLIGTTASVWTVDIFTAFLLIVIGVFVGKLTKWLLKLALVKGLRLNLLFKHGLLETLLTVAKWIVYILFIQTAIIELHIPTISNWMLDGLHVIPSLVISLFILGLGFAIGKSLRNGIKDIGGKEWELLGQICFVFFIYISVLAALDVVFDTILIDFAEGTSSDTIFIVLSALWGAAIAWNYRRVLKK